jgi:hypothetical protein
MPKAFRLDSNTVEIVQWHSFFCLFQCEKVNETLLSSHLHLAKPFRKVENPRMSTFMINAAFRSDGHIWTPDNTEFPVPCRCFQTAAHRRARSEKHMPRSWA